jgi:hypothetical protein
MPNILAGTQSLPGSASLLVQRAPPLPKGESGRQRRGQHAAHSSLPESHP